MPVVKKRQGRRTKFSKLAEEIVHKPVVFEKTPAKPFPMTMQEEIALAVVLWRAVRFRYTKERDMVDPAIKKSRIVYHGRPYGEDKVNETAIRMAEKLGVKKEFFDLMFAFPVFKLFVVNLDPWPQELEGVIPPERQVVEVPALSPKKKGGKKK